jgi:hypothetical protein
VDAAAAVHHFGFKFGLEGLDLAEHRKAAGGAAHLAFELIENLMQPLGGGPKRRVVLSRCGIHVHDGSVGFLDIMIFFACGPGQ